MCPSCIANIAVLATTSSGGVAAIALKTFCSRRQPNEKRQRNENNKVEIRSKGGVSERVGGGATEPAGEREETDSGSRLAGRRASPDAVAGRRERVRVRRTQG